MSFRSCVVAVIAAAQAVYFGALAQQPAVSVADACKSEIASLCADSVGKGGGAGFRCLTDNQAKLTGACADAMKVAQERRRKIRAVCQADIDKLCAGAEASGGGLMQCLSGKAAELSKPCADVVATLPAPVRK